MSATGGTISAVVGREAMAGLPQHDVTELFGAASRRLGRSLQFDAAVWMAADPTSGLPAAPTRAENMLERTPTVRECVRVWEAEFLTEDVTPFSALNRSKLPAGGLHLATHGRPARSPRYRDYLQEKGFEDELRAVLRVDGRPWGMVCLFRDHGRPAFDEEEVAMVGSVSKPIGQAVRELARPTALGAPAERGPGLMLLTADGELASVNEDALAWIDELPPDAGCPDPRGHWPRPFMLATATRARGIARARERGVARVRMQSRTGRWLVCHASCLQNSDGSLGHTAVVIEPAKAAEIAPILVKAYELTQREEEIVRLISQGFGTAEIASYLHLSRHTVRDYVKAVFEKLRVSSRGELVAKLFSEHYSPIHVDTAAREVVSV